MNWKKGIKRILVAFGVLIGLVAILVAIVVTSGMAIRLDYLRPAIERGASDALGRPVKIEGAIELVPNLRPTVSVGRVEIGNPPEWPAKQFVSIELARTQIDIPELLAREISIGEITADGIALHLTSSANDQNNWTITTRAKRQPTETMVTKSEEVPTPEAGLPEERRIRFTALDHLSLTNISVHYLDEALDKAVEFRIDDFSGSAKAGEPVQFSLEGSLQGYHYTVGVNGGSLDSLRDRATDWPLKVSGDIAGTPIEATGTLDRAADVPKIHLGFTLGQVDIGAILEKLKIVEGLETSTKRFTLETTLVGDSLNELITHSELSAKLEGGQLVLKDPNTRAERPINIVNGSIRIAPEQSVTMNVNGRIDQTPVVLTIVGTSLAKLVMQPEAITVHIGVEAVGATIALDGRLAMPIQSRDASLAMTVEGETLDSLEELIPVDLPPFGPYRLQAHFAAIETGYELSDLHVNVGESELEGVLRLDTSGTKPLAEVDLTSKRLQLADFSLEGWSPESQKDAAQMLISSRDAQIAEQTAQQAKGLFSPDVLNAFDATLRVSVADVFSGEDDLGGGDLGVAVEDGKLSVDPLRLDLPGGTLQMAFAYQPTQTANTVHLNMHIEQFDVGIPVRRIDPDSKLGGVLSLDLELDGTAPDVRHMLANTSGHVDFAFWPENLAVGIVDLWAVNVITLLAQQVDDEPASTLNCMVARFGLEQGVMREKTIFMDTTRMSVSADATIDFRDETVDILAVPKAKQPEYFSLATPVKVQGSFSDFGIGVNTLSIAKTAVTFITSPITVTVKRLFSGKVPADGKMACGEAWRKDTSED